MLRILSNDYKSNLPKESSVAHGGPATFAHTFSQFVSDHGHEWIGLIHAWDNSPDCRIQKEATRKGRTYYQCFFPGARIRLSMLEKKKPDPRIWYKDEIETIQKFIRRIKPDVLFLNGFSIYAWLLLEAAHKEGLPIVIQHAGIARIEFDLYKHFYSRAGRAMVLEMEQDIVKAAAKQIFLNTYSRDTFCSVVAPVPKKQSCIVPLPYLHAYDKAIASGLKSKSPNDKVVIGCVARWDRIKNHKAILNLAKEAKKQGMNWEFKVVTQIPDTTVDIRFKNAYRKHIEVVPPMDRTLLASYYQSVDLLILPSLFDVSPTVVMEAALMGKRTVISTGVGWNSEYRACGMKNWIADFSDPIATVKKIQYLIKHKPSNAFLEMIRKDHAPETVFNAYINALTEASNICV